MTVADQRQPHANRTCKTNPSHHRGRLNQQALISANTFNRYTVDGTTVPAGGPYGKSVTVGDISASGNSTVSVSGGFSESGNVPVIAGDVFASDGSHVSVAGTSGTVVLNSASANIESIVGDEAYLQMSGDSIASIGQTPRATVSDNGQLQVRSAGAIRASSNAFVEVQSGGRIQNASLVERASMEVKWGDPVRIVESLVLPNETALNLVTAFGPFSFGVEPAILNAPIVVLRDRTSATSGGTLGGHGLLDTPEFINDGTVLAGYRLNRASGGDSIGNTGRPDWKDIAPLADDRDELKASFHFSGNYTQSRDGLLELRIDRDAAQNREDEDKLTSALLVNGAAKIDGELRLKVEDGYRPDPGDRFSIVRSPMPIVGTFGNFDQTLDDENETFWVLNSTSDRYFGIGMRKAEDDGNLEALVLRTPRELKTEGIAEERVVTQFPLADRKKKLVIVTHGTMDRVLDEETLGVNGKESIANGLGSLATSMQSFIDGNNPNGVKLTDWAVAAFDWQEYATGDDFDHDGTLWNPFESARVGQAIGRGLAGWLDQKNLVPDELQIMAHSSGSWLIDGLAAKFDELGISPEMHITYFDTFFPPQSDLGPLEGTGPSRFAEQYYDSGKVILGTNERLPDVANLDVRNFDESFTVLNASHSWPYRWYERTVQALAGDKFTACDIDIWCGATDWGFIRSPVFRDYADIAGISLSSLPDFPALSGQLTLPWPIDVPKWLPAIRIEENGERAVYTSESGEVTWVDDDKIRLDTGSPVYLTAEIETLESANILRFEFQFLSEADSILSVLVDNIVIAELSEMIFVTNEIYQTPFFRLRDNLESGIHTITFRVDPTTSEQSSVILSGIQFGYVSFVAVPEPNLLGHMVLASFACVLGFRRKNAFSAIQSTIVRYPRCRHE